MSKFEIYYPFDAEIYLIGPFNKWGNDLTVKDKLKKNGVNYELEKILSHKTPYLFKINGKFVRDPLSIFFDDNLNSIYWDFKNSSTYKQKYKYTANPSKSLKVLQTDLPGLITHFKNKHGQLGFEINPKDTYKYITDSGVIEKIKDLGFNAVQFLPFNKSIDGDNWKFRYLSAFPNAIEDKWGDPDDFSQMIDAFHEYGISIIQDVVFSHTPYKGFKINGIESSDSALPSHYLGDETTWGTKRYKYDDPNIRNYLIKCSTNFIKNYHIDGIRIDNVDGILRYGDNGDGKDRPGGREFLRELNSSIYKINKNALISLEAHYFKEDNAKMLIAPITSSPKALGATMYMSSRETYFFQTDYMLKSADDIKPSRIKEIIEEKEWGESNSCIADFHNHDAAAGLMEMRATGSYAYDALLRNNHHLHDHAIGKIKVMETIISLCLEGRSLDLLQTFLLQTGSFEHDSSIEWYKEMIEVSKAMIDYKREINILMDSPAFWPKNVNKRKILAVDDLSKTITFQKDKFIIFINMSAEVLGKYNIAVEQKGEYELVLNSDELKFAGSGRTLIPQKIETKPGPKLRLDWIAPYQVLVFRKV